MKAAHALILIIVLIAASHLRREVIMEKRHALAMQKRTEQKFAINNVLPDRHPATGNAADIAGSRETDKKSSLYYYKRKQ